MSFWTKPKVRGEGKLAVITCLFSPQRHERRKRNFAEFRKQFGTNLYIAELAYGEDAWETPEGQNVVHFRGGPGHVLWQKERLLNALIRRLPRHVTAVAWVDADILFVDPDWQARALEQLGHSPVIQLFDSVIHLNADGFPEAQGPGLVAVAAKGGIDAYAQRKGAAGFAWAAQRELLEQVGLLDFMVLGGADTYMACGFAGMRPEAVFGHLTSRTRRAVEVWSDRAVALTGGKCGFIAGTIEHQFHGALQTRGYLQRYDVLRRGAFDPASDIIVEESGLYAWKTSKAVFHAEVASYFERRALAENE